MKITRIETFLVPPRGIAPSAFEGMTTMCRTYGGFEPALLELSTLGADWGPVLNGEAIALVADGTAQEAGPEGTVAVRLEPPPSFAIAIAWRRGDDSPILDRFLGFIRTYRDDHAWAEVTA